MLARCEADQLLLIRVSITSHFILAQHSVDCVFSFDFCLPFASGLQKLCTRLQKDYQHSALQRLKKRSRSSRRLRAAYHVLRAELDTLGQCERRMAAVVKSVADARNRKSLKEL